VLADGFGDLLRRFRIKASLTQEALAERSRISPATIAALEQGRRTAPRLSTVRLIAGALELPPTDVALLARAASGSGGAERPSHAVGSAAAAHRDAVAGEVGRSRLPVPLTPLFGRHAETGAVSQLLATERLVTLAGPGGVGKTRLALEVASQVQDKFTGGAWWIELGPVRDPDDVPGAALRALGDSEQPAGPVREQLRAALRGGRVLLIIDNCEHVLDAAATLTAGLLTQPSVTVLATSREPLAIPGEIRWPVPALAIPARDTPGTTESLLHVDSVALFVERAARARPHFAPGDDDCAAIARICRRLDGLPLALELAAAQIGNRSARQLAEDLDARIPLAAISARGVQGRHSTLRASIDWSYQLLSPAEQAGFRCLACFGTSFSSEAFLAVTARTAGTGRPAGTGVEPALIEKSLLVAGARAGRYRVLETIRAFAAERAAEAGELDAIRDAHAEHYASWLSGLHAADPSDEVLDRIDAEYPNLRAALVWSIESRSPRAGTIVAAMSVVWHQRARFHDVWTLGDGALGVVAHSDPVLCAQAAGAIPMRAPARLRTAGRAAQPGLLAAAQAAMRQSAPHNLQHAR
jgi:predicted ATPase/transcriptional regulator with XRE-family HTH domain